MSGGGIPAVLLHGFTGDDRSWRPVQRYLRRRGEILCPLLLGHGAGWRRRAAGVETFDDEVDRLARVIRRQAGGKVLLAGYSLGARLALGLAVRHPRLIARGVLIGGRPGLADDGERRRRAAADDALAEILEAEGIAAFVARWEQLPLFASQARLPAAVRREQRRRRLAHDPRGLAQALRRLSPGRMPDYRPRLPRLDVPLRLLAGAEDRAFRAAAEEMAALLPRARLDVVPGAGHNLILEAPRVVAAIIDEEWRPCQPRPSTETPVPTSAAT